MPSPILDQLTAQVTETTGVEQSAITLIEGIQARIDAAVQQALDNGATAEQLQPISDLSTAMETQTQALAAAIQAQGG
jgi:C4-type Zn-finger protein